MIIGTYLENLEGMARDFLSYFEGLKKNDIDNCIVYNDLTYKEIKSFLFRLSGYGLLKNFQRI